MKKLILTLTFLLLTCSCSAQSTSLQEGQSQVENSETTADSESPEIQASSDEKESLEQEKPAQQSENTGADTGKQKMSHEELQPETGKQQGVGHEELSAEKSTESDPVSVYESSVLAQYRELNSSNIKEANVNRNYVRDWDAIDFYSPTIKLGYSLDDLNSDGIPELLICSQNESGDISVVDAFTFDGQQAISVISGEPAATPKGVNKGLANGAISVMGDGTLSFMDNGGPGQIISYYELSESYKPANCFLKLKEGYLGPDYMDTSANESVCFKEVNGQREVISDSQVQELKQQYGSDKGVRVIQNLVDLTDWINKGIPSG